MKTKFDFKNGCWSGDKSASLSRYDLVFKTPMTEPIHHGIPLGNGDMGALVWTQSEKLIIAVNKCDLWDIGTLDKVTNWSDTDEDYACCLRHACRLVVDFGMPVFDAFYLKSFKAVLHISQGTLTVESESVFGKLSLLCFVDYNSNVLKLSVKTSFKETAQANVYIERYGSRTFSHWFSKIRTTPEIGTDGTNAFVFEDGCGIWQKVTSGKFLCYLSDKNNGECRKYHSRKAGYSFIGEDTFYLSVTSPFENDAMSLADSTVAAAKKNDKLLEKHKASWLEVLTRSHIECGDLYYDALWHFGLYLLVASQRGKYPGRFINGLWGWSRDVQNWNYYFHWNQQELYWGLNAAGLSEMCEPYLNYRFDSIKYGEQDARELFGAKGIWVSDVCDALGRNSAHEDKNRTPAFEIAMDFYRQYQYTQDEEFLRQKAAPYITKAALFLESIAEKRNDGLYHFPNGSCYEGGFEGEDTEIELACAKVLLPVAIAVARSTGIGAENIPTWEDMAAHLPDFTFVEADRREITIRKFNATYEKGCRKGKCAPSNKVISVGKSNRLGFFINSLDFEDYRVFPTTRASAAFPTGCIGIKDIGTENYDALANALLVSEKSAMGWDTLPIAYARMGLSDALDAALECFPADWLRYENGFGHYNPKTATMDIENPFVYSRITDMNDRQREAEISLKPFAHMGLEPTGVIVATMCEMLLQSYDGTLRIAPAVCSDRDASFTLYAAGNFKVSAEIEQGRVNWVYIESLSGKALTLENPWECAFLNGECHTERIISLSTNIGDALLFTPTQDIVFETYTPTYKQNDGCIRHKSGASFGLEQKF